MIELRWPVSIWKIRRQKSEQPYYVLSSGVDNPPGARMGEIEEGPIVDMTRVAILPSIELPKSEDNKGGTG